MSTWKKVIAKPKELLPQKKLKTTFFSTRNRISGTWHRRLMKIFVFSSQVAADNEVERILIKVSSSRFTHKTYAPKLKSLFFFNSCFYYLSVCVFVYSPQNSTNKMMERNEQTSVMKFIIIFSLSSIKLFTTEAESIWEMLFYTTRAATAAALRCRSRTKAEVWGRTKVEANEGKAYFPF